MGELPIHNLDGYLSKYGCDVFIETGTGMGQGVEYALSYPFSKLFSIEYMKELYDKCVSKFNDGRLELLNTDSLSGLNSILSTVAADVPILFWLDAHFPGADFQIDGCTYDHLSDQPDVHKPLKKEIQLIKIKRPANKDVFIIDDLQLYERGPFEIPYVPGFVDKYGEDGISFIEREFENTHYFRRDYRHQGFLILTPI